MNRFCQDVKTGPNYIWPITLLELNYITTPARNAALSPGVWSIEVQSFLLKRRERTLEAGSEVIEMLEGKEDRWFGGLEDNSPKVKWMRRVYPRVD